MDQSRRIRIESNGISLSAALHCPAALPAPVIVCCHGLLSYKDSPKYIEIGEYMSAAGFCVLRFDFSGCGDSPRRKEPLVDSRRRDLETVLNFARTQPWSDGRVGLLGSSLGGFLAILAMADSPDAIAAVVSWAAPCDVSRLDPGKSGFEELEGIFPEGLSLGEPQNLDSATSAERVLLIHGRQDEVVPWKSAVLIYSLLKDPKELILIEDADHRFLDDPLRRTAIKASRDWFKRFFGT